MGGWSKEEMIEYNRLCTTLKQQMLSQDNNRFEIQLEEQMHRQHSGASDDLFRAIKEARIGPYSNIRDIANN